MVTPFWLNDPTILFRQDNITQVWPIANMTSNEKLNAMTRMVVVLTILGYLLSQTLKIVVTGIVTLLAIIVLRYANEIATSITPSPRRIFESGTLSTRPRCVYAS